MPVMEDSGKATDPIHEATGRRAALSTPDCKGKLLPLANTTAQGVRDNVRGEGRRAVRNGSKAVMSGVGGKADIGQADEVQSRTTGASSPHRPCITDRSDCPSAPSNEQRSGCRKRDVEVEQPQREKLSGEVVAEVHNYASGCCDSQ